jgi:transposase
MTTDARQLSERESKALAIATHTQLVRKPNNTWIVPSQSGAKTYTVNPDPESPFCNCPDFEFRRARCKHVLAVEIVLKREIVTDGQTQTVTETVTVKQKYSQSWPEYNKAQSNEKAHFLAFLHELCSGIEEPIQTNGRPRLPLSDIIFAATFKTYSTVSGRRFMSDLRDALTKGYITRMPSYNSIFDYLKMESLTPYLKQMIIESSMPLKSVEQDFAVDSSGFSSTCIYRWFDVKYGKQVDYREWIKVHIMTGVRTNIVTSVELSKPYANDSPFFKPLVEQAAKSGFGMSEISADKAYASELNFQVAVDQGATAYIPFKSNVKGVRGSELWKRMFHFYSFKREEFLAHYHKRSNVETTFSMIKRKFGERLRSKTETAQINEALCKILCHNLCVVTQSMYELNITPEFWGEAA